jgi:DNA-binding MarR family transcriptional regulator
MPESTKAARAKPVARGAAPVAAPLTVSHPPLLPRGSDRRFRHLLADFLTVATQLELVRSHLGGRVGLTGPQYSILMAIAHLQGDRGVPAGIPVGRVAEQLHVSSAFVTAETGKLARRGLLQKRPNPDDGRGVLLGLTASGHGCVAALAPEVRQVNDLFFGALDGPRFEALSAVMADMVGSAAKALAHIEAIERTDALTRRRVGAD